MKDLLEQAIDSTRTQVGNLGPTGVARGQLGGRTGLACANHAGPTWPDCGPVVAARDISLPRADVRIVVFESVREALFNVVKHANCDRAQVELRLGESAAAPGRSGSGCRLRYRTPCARRDGWNRVRTSGHARAPPRRPLAAFRDRQQSRRGHPRHADGAARC